MPETTVEKIPQKAQDLFNKGFGAFERGNLSYAIELLFHVVELEPGFVQARKFLRAAEVQQHRKVRNNAVARVLATLRGYPAYVKALALVQSGKAGQALAAVEHALRRNPLEARFLKTFAEAALAAEMAEAAIPTLEFGRDAHPGDVELVNWLGRLYQKVGRNRDARICFERICELRPSDPKALKALKDAMALDSMSTDGWEEAAASGGTYRSIIKDVGQAVRLEQESKAVKSERDIASLIEETLEKMQAEPENINYYRALARLYVQKQMFGEAVETLQKAIAISPGDPELDAALAATRVQQFNEDIRALREAGKTAEAESRELERDQFVYDNLQERVKRYPNDLRLRYELGVILFKNGYVSEAIQQFQLSQRSPKNRARSLYYLALCFREKKQYDLAGEQLESAASELFAMDEEKKDILYALGELAELTGDRKKALEYFKQIYQVDIGYRDIAQKVEGRPAS